MAAEDVVWAVAVAAVEEVVAAEVSDQPTDMSRTKSNHCLNATSTWELFAMEQADGQNVNDITDCVQRLREQDTDSDHSHGQDSLCRRIRPSDCHQKGIHHKGKLRPG